jgi:cystathionine gamma-lyase
MKKAPNAANLATRCIHGGDTVDPATGAVMPAIYTSTTFRQPEFGQPGPFVYARASNPTRDALERCVADLESGVRALAFSAGQAATAAVLELLDEGSHVLAPADIYGGTLRLFNQVRSRTSGLRVSYVDFADMAQVEAAIRPETRLIWLESPTNPLLTVIDLAAVVDLAGRYGLRVAVDNTFATPCSQRPLEFGCDIVMHSATKYMGGHSDVLAGLVVVADEELGKQLLSLRSAVGSVMGPFDAYLVLRGLKTLSLRMERHASNAAVIASWLQDHSRIARVIYPGLASHPQHELAARQMENFGGVVTAELSGDLAFVESFMNRLQVFTLAESLGGVESLAGHPATMSHSNVPPEVRREMGIPDSLVRLSVGIEHIDDLIADLDEALA